MAKVVKSNTAKQIVLKALKQIAGKEKKLSAEKVVTAASNENHPLHKYFTWEDSVAAHKYRLFEAERLIRTAEYQIRVNNIMIAAPYYLRDPAKERNEPGYVEAADLRNRPDEAHAALINELSAAKSHLQRARDVGMSLGFFEEIDGMLGSLVNLTKKVGEVAA